MAWGSRRWDPGDDRGATAVDYLGTVVVVSAIVAMLSGTEIGARVYDGIHIAICRITGGGCSGASENQADRPKTDQDFEPRLCNTANTESRAGSEVKVGWFSFGNEYGFQQQEFRTPDGNTKVFLTFTDAASVGAKASPRPGVKLGRLGVDEVELAAGVKVTNGDTWVFGSPEEAERFRGDIEELKAWEGSMKYGGMSGPNFYGGYKWAEKNEEIEKKLGEQHISFGKIGLEATGELALQQAKIDEGKLSAQLGGRFKVSPEATVTSNESTKPPTKSYTYQFQLEGTANVDVEAGPGSIEQEGGQVRTGTMTVTRYQDGSLARVDLTQSVEARGTGSAKAEGTRGDNKAGARASEKDRTVTTTTNSLSFPPGDQRGSQADRQTVENWLDGSGDNTAPFRYLFGDQAPTRRPGADDPFGRLMFDKGQSSRTVHLGITDAQEFGFEVNLGLSLGAKLSFESSQERLQKAEFLGAPKPGGTRKYVPYSYCAK